MSEPTLIIVTGMPCTGKTTLSKHLAARIALPLVSKDGIKETLFETLGVADRKSSQRLGAASFELLFYFIESQMQAGRSLIAEANFHADSAGPRLQAIRKSNHFKAIQLVCQTESSILLERYRERMDSSERHPGHFDMLNADDFRATVAAGDWQPIPIESEIIYVNTTHFDAIDYDDLVGHMTHSRNVVR